MLKRFSNPYGMVKQDNQEKDDWKAFYSIQLQRYFTQKGTSHFVNEAEADMIWQLIFETWREIKRRGILHRKKTCDKLELFKQTRIVFPIIGQSKRNDIIYINFRIKEKMTLERTCFCGSGLPLCKCCGRILTMEELAFGGL